MPVGLSNSVKITYGNRFRPARRSIVVKLNKTQAQLRKERQKQYGQLAGASAIPSVLVLNT
jgi:hypothetical protein